MPLSLATHYRLQMCCNSPQPVKDKQQLLPISSPLYLDNSQLTVTFPQHVHHPFTSTFPFPFPFPFPSSSDSVRHATFSHMAEEPAPDRFTSLSLAVSPPA
ncbi:uncharacterized protein TrAFT101_009568 [Trichoderma asperellum]|uniref:uncharacterized protein n=1 Tax=Trichoderma asperellum TaxID=101201 RepID=UPI0033229D65|nr:hypothetical protein TrAFT101_009568 [Trichoderma asperellum]